MYLTILMFFCNQDENKENIEENISSNDRPTEPTYPWRPTKSYAQVFTT